MRKNLSTPQIKALRHLHEGGAANVIRKTTMTSLRTRGYVRGDELTPFGERTIKRYLDQTGDGPEDLKAMFRLA